MRAILSKRYASASGEKAKGQALNTLNDFFLNETFKITEAWPFFSFPLSPAYLLDRMSTRFHFYLQLARACVPTSTDPKGT